MWGYSLARSDFLELLYHKYKPMEEEILNGCLGTGEQDTDYLFSWEMLENLPELELQDTQIYEYDQSWTTHCTLYSAFGAVSDLFNYERTQKEIDEMVEESYKRGRIKWEWWYIKSAVDLVADYWNENHAKLWRVVYYRVSLSDTELVDKILTKNYTLCSGYDGNSAYNKDRNDNVILNGTDFWTATYGHAVSWIGRNWKRYIKDNYKGRTNYNNKPTNIYEVEHEPKELVKSGCYMRNAYLYTKVDNLEEIKRLEKFKTAVNVAIELNSSIWHLTNDENYKNALHTMNNENRKKQNDIEAQLKKYV